MNPLTRNIRVIYDTNIFISFLLPPVKPGTITEIIEAAVIGQVRLLLPEPLLDELLDKVTIDLNVEN